MRTPQVIHGWPITIHKMADGVGVARSLVCNVVLAAHEKFLFAGSPQSAAFLGAVDAISIGSDGSFHGLAAAYTAIREARHGCPDCCVQWCKSAAVAVRELLVLELCFALSPLSGDDFDHVLGELFSGIDGELFSQLRLSRMAIGRLGRDHDEFVRRLPSIFPNEFYTTSEFTSLFNLYRTIANDGSQVTSRVNTRRAHRSTQRLTAYRLARRSRPSRHESTPSGDDGPQLAEDVTELLPEQMTMVHGTEEVPQTERVPMGDNLPEQMAMVQGTEGVTEPLPEQIPLPEQMTMVHGADEVTEPLPEHMPIPNMAEVASLNYNYSSWLSWVAGDRED